VRSPRVIAAEMPLLQRAVIIGTTVAGFLGAIVGLLIGLAAYPPTAFFAVIEIGLPAAVAGALVGLLVGSAILAVHRFARSR
jgi:hypothetical protein